LGITELLPKPRQDLVANTPEYEQLPLVRALGFREYDARWIFEKEINLYGIQAIGLGIGTLIHRRGIRPDAVTGHDFRGYSAAIKHALTTGLIASGCTVHDIGMCLTPMTYFAQFALDVPAVAMVTASHNDNGWTGIKMGVNRPLTFGPADMIELKQIVMQGQWELRGGGGLIHVSDFETTYKADLLKSGPLKNPLKVCVVCGNGTAGAFAPQVLRDLGCEVVEIHCDLDHTFPNYNPNPEDLEMLEAMKEAVIAHKADIAFGFDGDGDRCGVVDNEGNSIFSDKIGVMVARHMAAKTPNAKFVVDVKSTSLFKTDPILRSLGATVDYWKTGHSYLKQRTTELDAIAGFEKSGHFFFRAPYGRGYDDGINTAIVISRMLDEATGKTMADLFRELPVTWGTPTMSPHCPDEEKYDVVDQITAMISLMARDGKTVAGYKIIDLNTVNGIRFTLEDGSWGLIRASSNKPELVIVCESLRSEGDVKAIFTVVESLLAKFPSVGAFNQKI
jgi:phosphomannomutase / phosphoglucomutase